MGIWERLFRAEGYEPSIEARLDNIIRETMRLEELRRSHAEAMLQRKERAKARKVARIECYAKSRKNAKRGRVAIKRRSKPLIFTAGQIFRAIIGR